MWGREPIGGPFALTDHTGKRRTDADFRGKLMLVYFGFTYCPDVCPTDLQAIGWRSTGSGRRPSGAAAVHHRRSGTRHAGALAEYVPLFHPRLIGLTGSSDAGPQGRERLQGLFRQGRRPAGADDYTVDHTSFIYLMDATENISASFRRAPRRTAWSR